MSYFCKVLMLFLQVCVTHSLLHNQCANDTTMYFDDSIDRCCRMCEPGYHALARCTRKRDTICTPCREREFTEKWNYVRVCQLCYRCDSGLGLRVRVNCSLSHNIECECEPGLHCSHPEDCSHCDSHTHCAPGKGVSVRGTGLMDTQCEICTDGSFQSFYTLNETCKTHTDCRSLGLSVLSLGDSVTDTVCDRMTSVTPPTRPQHATGSVIKSLLVSLSVSIVILIVAGILIFCCLRHKRNRWEIQHEAEVIGDRDLNQILLVDSKLDWLPVKEERDEVEWPRGPEGPGEGPQIEGQAPAYTNGIGSGLGKEGEAWNCLNNMKLSGCQVEGLTNSVTVNGCVFIYHSDTPGTHQEHARNTPHGGEQETCHPVPEEGGNVGKEGEKEARTPTQASADLA